MKRILSLLTLIVILISCTPKDEYVIKGTVSGKNLDGIVITLYDYDGNQMVKIDTAIVKNNKFEFKGKQEDPIVYYALSDAQDVFGDIAMGVPVLVKNGKITMDIKDNEVRIGGNNENNSYQAYVDLQRPVIKKLSELREQADDADEEGILALQTEYSALMEEARVNTVNYVFDNINNPLGEQIFTSSYQLFTKDQIKDVLSLANESFASHPLVVEIMSQLEPKGKLKQGTDFMDFTLPDTNGKNVSLSDYVGKGKYVLVDFWASWCRPCLMELPDLVDLYKELKEHNFEIVGVSLDQDKESWINCIKEYNITWPQLSDLKGSNSAAKPYDVTAIPYTVLIGPDGKIIADNLRGEQLEEVIYQAMNILR